METGGKGKNKLDITKTKTKKKAEKKAEKKAKKEAEKKTKKKSGRTCNILFCWSFRPSKAVRYNDAEDSDENDATAQTNIAEEILDTTQKNRDRKQDCRAIEDTSGKHVVNEEIAERASSKRLSSYDNISNSENFQQQPPTRIDVVPSLLSEEKKREMVPIHAQIEYNSIKQQDSMVRQEQPEKYKGRKSKDVPTQKRVEHVVHNNREEEVLVISQETFKGHERRKYENMPPQKQDSVIEGMKTENEPDEKEPIPDYMKPEEADLGNYQGTAHVQASTTSASRPFNEVNSTSSTNSEAKLQHVNPPTQGTRVPKQNHQLRIMSQHFIQRSFSQEFLPCPRAKPSNRRSENTLCLYLSTFREDSSGRQQYIVSRVIDSESMPEIPAKNKDLAENSFCLAKVVDDVSRSYDKTPNYESLHDTSTDANQQRSETNISHPEPLVDLGIEQNSGGLLQDVDGLGNNRRTPARLLNTVYDSKAAHSESAIEEENKKIIYDTPTENYETRRTVEQLPAIISCNLDTLEVLDQDTDEFVVVTQTGCKLGKNVSDEIKDVVDKPNTDFRSENSCAMTKSLATQTDEDYVISAAETNDSIDKAVDENRNWFLDGEANNFTDDWRTVDSGDIGITITDEKVDWKDFTDDWRTVDSGDMGITITDEKIDWKDAVYDDSCDWRNAAFGDTEWKEAIIEDWKTGYSGETDETSDRMFEDQQNEFEAATDDNMKLAHTEMPNECDSNRIGHMAADVLSASTVENRLNEVNGPPDSRTESHQEHYSHRNSVFGRNDQKIEESFEDPQNLEHPAGQPRFTFETKCNIDIAGGRPAEDILPISKELDLSTNERHSSRAFRRVGDNQDGGAFVEGHQSEAEGQDIAGVRENTNDPAIEKVNDMAKRKNSTDTSKKTGYPLETEPVNDQEEGQVSSPIEAVAQVPYEKDAAATANEKKNAIVKRNKSKDAPEEISKLKRINARHRPIVGLQNLGNTCFFNAVMQNINQSSLLYDLLKDQKFDRLHLTGSMVKFYRMVSGSSSTITPSEVLRNVCIRSPRFGGGKQQDSHELLRHLLDGLRNEERELSGNPNNRKTLTQVDKVFGGHFMTVYTCKACKTPYHVCEPLLDMSLPIAFDDLQNDEESSINEEDDETTGDNVQYQKAVKYMMTPLAIKQKKDAQNNHNEYVLDAEVHQLSKSQRKRRNKKAKVQHSETKKSRRDGRSILDCLDAFTRTEHIADEYLCMACHENRVKKGATDYQMTSAKKRTLIYNPPALLTLHLKRFEQTEYGFVKCNDMISFEDMIDIGPYCSSWCMRNEENETSIWYSLYGLVVHGGGLDGGHYVAYVKLRETEDNVRRFIQESYLDRDQLTEETLMNMMEQQMHLMHDRIKRKETETLQPKPVKGTWFYISDSHCSQVQKEEVRRQEAYLLFYERREDKKSICYKRSTGNTETSV